MNTFEYNLKPVYMSSCVQRWPLECIIHYTMMSIKRTPQNKSAKSIICCVKKSKIQFFLIITIIKDWKYKLRGKLLTNTV